MSFLLTTFPTFYGVKAFLKIFLLLYPVDALLHIDFDKYDLFAVTADLETCETLKKFLIDDFNNRQEDVDEGAPLSLRLYKVGD
jgi:hypothetical protein